MNKMKIGLLTGTRPDIIKMAPLYWEGKRKGHETILIHSNQHKVYHLFEGVYKDLELKFPPHYILNNKLLSRAIIKLSKISSKIGQKIGLQITEKLESFGSKFVSPLEAQANATGRIILGMNNFFRKNNIDILLVHGDTLTCMAGSIAAYLNKIPVGHIEAGLRTISREPYPEQGCTRTADACSSLHFAATEKNRRNLLNEGFDKTKIFVVGNTVVDVANWAMKKGARSRKMQKYIDLASGKKLVYFSSHRRENVMTDRFKNIIRAVENLGNDYVILWSVRPSTRIAINNLGLQDEIKKHNNIFLVSDIPNYTDIMYLLSNCFFIITDSGSMQEEAAALRVPCITLRYDTDRPESVEAGVNILAPPSSVESIAKSIEYVIKNNAKMRKKKNPYGKGDSSKQIINIIKKFENNLIDWCK